MNSSEDYDLIIKAGKGEINYWVDIYKRKNLFYIFAWRDFKVRYKQTLLGISWSILQPLFTMLIFTIVFGKIAQLPSEGKAPYAIMVLAALLPWQFFANATRESSNSLLSNQNLITKVYFPRIIIPISTIVTCIIDMCIAFILLLFLFCYYNYIPEWQFFLLPLFTLPLLALTIGFGLILSSFNIKYRDFRYLIPFIIQAGLFISPVGFSSSIVPGKWQKLYDINPMAGIIDSFRWAILKGSMDFNVKSFIMATVMSLFILLLGGYLFRRTEKNIADII